MATETSHKVGEEGVTEVKEWLEATTRYAFTFTVYDSATMCTRRRLDGSKKTFDLEGSTVPRHSGEVPKPVSVEVKKYSSAADQKPQFREFLATADSHTALEVKEVGDPEREFVWVTYHPFNLTDWSKLHDVNYLKGCVEEHSSLLGDEKINLDLLARVAERTSLFVVGQRQVDLRLDKIELSVIRGALEKERG